MGRMDNVVPQLFDTMLGITTCRDGGMGSIWQGCGWSSGGSNAICSSTTVINGMVRKFLYAPRHDGDGGASQTETSVLAQEMQYLASDVDEIPYLTNTIENTTAST